MNAIAKKLQIKTGSGWLFVNAPHDYLELLQPLPDTVKISQEVKGQVDGVQLFVKKRDELIQELKNIKAVLKPSTILWVTYPKKSSGVPTDLEMMSNWNELLVYNLRPVASAAINEIWTALRFKPQDQVKVSNARNSEIKTNDLSAYIDVDTKTVTLPEDVQEALINYPEVLQYFNGLSYSHKKEYVVWILSAKQEKTRIVRVAKMVEMLKMSKKNPTEK